MTLRLPMPRWLTAYGTRFMPFADAASPELPLGRLLRLSLFQAVIGMVVALMVGTLNRVMIVELQVPTWWVALAVAIPMVFAPLRALIGYRSDTHPSALGLRRIPYLWTGTLLLFGGLAMMPFALLLLSEANAKTVWAGQFGAGLAFVLIGAGLQVTQTAGIALANDLATEDKRPRVVALLYSMLLLGMIGSSLVFGLLLGDFSPQRLIQVIQGTAELTLILKGAYRDESGRFGTGDLDEETEATEHQPIVEPGGECICISAIEGRMKPHGWLARTIQPLFGF